MLDRTAISPLSLADSVITLRMPAHDNGYAIINVGGACVRFLYLPPRLQDIPPGFITTVAGIGSYGGEYGPATSAWFPLAWGMALDRAGLLYFADTNNNRIMRVRADGTLEPFAGNGTKNGPKPSASTPALNVSINFPRSIAFDSRGNLIVPDDSFYLWRIDPNGVAEIIAGTGQQATSAPEGVPARETAIGQPSYVAVDPDDNIYFLDWPNARVRKIDRSGVLSTVAGNGTYGFSGDGGPATAAQFSQRFNDDGGLAIDRAGNILLVDLPNNRVRRIIRTTGIIETIIGPAVSGQQLDVLRGIAVSANDEIYFSNATTIYRRAADGTITPVVNGGEGFSEDGARAPGAKIGTVYALLVDPAGNLLYADAEVPRVRKIDRITNQISTLAGSGPHIFGEGGPAVAANASIQGLAFLPTGELILAGFNGLFEIDGSGRLIRIAGSGLPGPLFDVPALNARMNSPASVTFSSAGIFDVAGIWISRIDRDGILRHTAAKPGSCGFAGDGGSAVDALLCQAWDAVRDPSGNLVIADTNNNRIRRVDASGVITTIVGSGPPNGLERYGAGSSAGDGGKAIDARINTPYGVTFDDAGNLLICEAPGRGTGIRRVDANGIISTLAPFGCTKLTWAFGNLYTVVGRVTRVSRAGRVTELTARGDGFSGDGGPASLAHIEANTQATAVAADEEGNLFFNDGNNLRVRVIRYGAVLAPPDATIRALTYGSTIQATVLDSAGEPAEGVRVDFISPSSGPSCHFPNNANAIGVVTDTNGVATTSCVPDCLGNGSFAVTARPLTANASASVTMADVSGPCRRRAVRH